MKSTHLQRKYKKNPENWSGTPKISENGRKLPKRGKNPDSQGIRSDRKWVSGQRLSTAVWKVKFPVKILPWLKKNCKLELRFRFPH
jgi:hypothetical protein